MVLEAAAADREVKRDAFWRYRYGLPLTLKGYLTLAAIAALFGALIGYADAEHSNALLRMMLSDWPAR
jgi:hypothetical protein